MRTSLMMSLRTSTGRSSSCKGRGIELDTYWLVNAPVAEAAVKVVGDGDRGLSLALAPALSQVFFIAASSADAASAIIVSVTDCCCPCGVELRRPALLATLTGDGASMCVLRIAACVRVPCGTCVVMCVSVRGCVLPTGTDLTITDT